MTVVPRVSFLGANRAAQARLRAAYGRLDKANQQVATGKAYVRPSENTSASSRAAVLQSQQDELATFDGSINDARSRLAVVDDKTAQAMAIYQRTTELATQAANSINSPGSRLAIREEVEQLRGELVGIANATYLGAPVFAGLGAGNAVSYDTATSTWTFSGAPTERLTRRLAPGESVDASITAGELFSNGTSDIFSTLDQLSAALAADNTAGIQASLDKVNTLRSTLSAGQARMGAVANRVENAANRNSAIKITLTAELSKLQEVDMSDALTDQSRLSTAYQAALGVTAKATQQTLLDWLR